MRRLAPVPTIVILALAAAGCAGAASSAAPASRASRASRASTAASSARGSSEAAPSDALATASAGPSEPALSASPSAPASSTPAPSPSPPASPTPRPTSPSSATVTQITVANVIDAVLPSPGGGLLAAVTGDGSGLATQVAVYRADGRRLATYPATAASWLDATRLVTIDAAGHAALDTPGGGRTTLPGAYTLVLGSGRGRAALYNAKTSTIRVLEETSLGPGVASAGSPLAWSPDGSRLALAVPSGSASGGVRLACTGCLEPALATLAIVAVPGFGRVLTLHEPVFAAAYPVSYSPDGRSIAVSNAVIDARTGASVPLPDQEESGWTPDGRLVLVDGSYRSRLWSRAGTVSTGLGPGIPSYGPAMPDVAVASFAGSASKGSVAVRHGTRSVNIPAPAGRATWAGSVCFVATGTDDAQQQHDRLYRVEFGPTG